MKKFAALLLVFTMLLGAGQSVFAEVEPDEDIEGKIMIYTSMYPFAIDMITEALREKFPNLDAELFYGGTGDLQTKLAGEMGTALNGILSCDMLLVAEPSYSLELKSYGYLEPIEIDDPENLLRFDYDEEGYWYPVRVLNMVLAYNPELNKYEDVPHSFKDFAEDPNMKGYISMSNPLTSGTAMAAITALSDKYGYEYFDKLGENQVMVESGSTALAKLQTGECKEIMILEESVLKVRKEEQSKLEVIYPDDGVVLIPSTIMTVAEEKSANANIEACEAVTKWFLSKEGQHYITEAYMHGVLKGYEEIPYDSVSTDELIPKDIGVDWERCYYGREEIRTRFQEAVTTGN
jgi:iron(III) transport system substrate-binding protein